MKNLKLSLFSLAATVFIATVCMQQQVDPIKPIFEEIKADLKNGKVRDEYAFPMTEVGFKLKQKISALSKDEKNHLLKKIKNFYDMDTAIRITYPAKALYYRLLINAGADANYNMGTDITRADLLEEAIILNDLEMVRFLLNHGAGARAANYTSGPLLNIAKKVQIATLLINHHALDPYISNQKLLTNLILNIFASPLYEADLITLYETALIAQTDTELDFNIVDIAQNTLAHYLAFSAREYPEALDETDQNDFRKKLTILLNKKGALNYLDAQNNNGQSIIDIIEKKLEQSPNSPNLLWAQFILNKDLGLYFD